MKTKQTLSDPNLHTFTLANGLRVVLENRPRRTVTSAFIAVNVGSRHELEQQAGYSHFIEHMLFKGTKKYSAKKITSEVEKCGGYLNASTGYETTTFFIRIPSVSQKIAFKYLAEIFFHPEFPQKELEKERKVVIEEIHQRGDDPYQKMYEVGFRDLYGKHPLGRPIIGYEEIIKTCTRENLMDFYHSHYVTHNSVLSVVGRLWRDQKEREQVIAQIADFFDKETATNRYATAVKKAELKQGIKAEHKKEGISQTYFFVGLPGVKSSLYGGFEMDIYQRILGQGMSSRLFQRIREKLGLCYSIGAYNYPLSREGLFIVAGSSQSDAERAVSAIIDELKKSLDDITDKEIADAKTGLLGQYYITLDSVHATAEENCLSMLDHDEVKDSAKVINIINSITTEQVKTYMKKLWKDFKPSVITLS